MVGMAMRDAQMVEGDHFLRSFADVEADIQLGCADDGFLARKRISNETNAPDSFFKHIRRHVVSTGTRRRREASAPRFSDLTVLRRPGKDSASDSAHLP